MNFLWVILAIVFMVMAADSFAESSHGGRDIIGFMIWCGAAVGMILQVKRGRKK